MVGEIELGTLWCPAAILTSPWLLHHCFALVIHCLNLVLHTVVVCVTVEQQRGVGTTEEAENAQKHVGSSYVIDCNIAAVLRQARTLTAVHSQIKGKKH